MSSLELKARHGDDRRVLFRRHHDASGVGWVRIARLPEEAADAILRGGMLRVTLREDAGPEQAPWILSVSLDGKDIHASFLDDFRLDTLIECDDAIKVEVVGGDLAFRKRELMRLRHELEDIEAKAERIRARIRDVEAGISGHEAPRTETCPEP